MRVVYFWFALGSPLIALGLALAVQGVPRLRRALYGALRAPWAVLALLLTEVATSVAAMVLVWTGIRPSPQRVALLTLFTLILYSALRAMRRVTGGRRYRPRHEASG